MLPKPWTSLSILSDSANFIISVDLIYSSRIPSIHARILATQIRRLLGSIATGMGANGDE
jgi:hypothetical protein